MFIQDVNGCGNCPYGYINNGTWGSFNECTHPNNVDGWSPTDAEIENDNGLPPPAWCPLRKESVTITLNPYK